jgi:hypothetical protein
MLFNIFLFLSSNILSNCITKSDIYFRHFGDVTLADLEDIFPRLLFKQIRLSDRSSRSTSLKKEIYELTNRYKLH